MRVTTTRRITAGAVVMFEIDTYDIGALTLCGGLVSSNFPSVVSLEDIYEQIVNAADGVWVKGHLQATQKDANGADIYADLDGGPRAYEVYSVEVFG